MVAVESLEMQSEQLSQVTKEHIEAGTPCSHLHYVELFFRQDKVSISLVALSWMVLCFLTVVNAALMQVYFIMLLACFLWIIHGFGVRR